jgi:hypothetical protein
MLKHYCHQETVAGDATVRSSICKIKDISGVRKKLMKQSMLKHYCNQETVVGDAIVRSSI